MVDTPKVERLTANVTDKFWCGYCVPHNCNPFNVDMRSLKKYQKYGVIYYIGAHSGSSHKKDWACEKHALELGWIW